MIEFLKSLFGSPAPSEMVALGGKITRYGMKNDRWGDSASLGIGKYKQPTGFRDNVLRPTSLAVSPDVREAFVKAGIKPLGEVEIFLTEQTRIRRTWDDVTANDHQAQALGLPPLRGRFDLFCPNNENQSLDGLKVIGFRKV